MGRGDNRVTRKMRKIQNQKRKKLRLKNKIAESNKNK